MQEEPSVHQALQLTVDSIKRVFTKINPRKAAGPDHIPGCVLKGCAEQLKDVFLTYLTSLSARPVYPPV